MAITIKMEASTFSF